MPGDAMYDLVGRLFPLCRSITGDGVRQTLAILDKEITLDITEVPSGTEVFDWVVPHEWTIRDAWVRDDGGRRVIDFQASNLHVVSYSEPVQRVMSLAELRPHLFTLPEHPDWIPYRTSYYKRDWGFCLSQRQLDGLAEGDYEVCIDSTLAPGHLTYGEHFVPGETDDEVLFSCHICHPSLANDNLSGVSVAVELARWLASAFRRYSYRFLFIPGTIGSIAWLAGHEPAVARVRHGLVLACVGDPGRLTYKRSRRADADIDRVVGHVLDRSGRPHRIIPFSPYGYDERQFCSPGFNLAVGCLSRTPYAEFPEYHTSADDLDLITAAALEESLRTCQETVTVLEANRRYRNLKPKCEPQLGRRGLYGPIGGASQTQQQQLAMLWVLNLADGGHDLLDTAERAGLPFAVVAEAAAALVEAGLLTPAP